MRDFFFCMVNPTIGEDRTGNSRFQFLRGQWARFLSYCIFFFAVLSVVIFFLIFLQVSESLIYISADSWIELFFSFCISSGMYLSDAQTKKQTNMLKANLATRKFCTSTRSPRPARGGNPAYKINIETWHQQWILNHTGNQIPLTALCKYHSILKSKREILTDEDVYVRGVSRNRHSCRKSSSARPCSVLARWGFVTSVLWANFFFLTVRVWKCTCECVCACLCTCVLYVWSACACVRACMHMCARM